MANYFFKQLNDKWLLSILTIICLFIVLLTNHFGPIIPVLVFGSIIFVIVFYLSFYFPRYNIVLLIGTGLVTPFLMRALNLYTIPIVIASEALCLIMILTLILNRRISGLRTMPGMLFLTWTLYHLIELVNPNSSSLFAGLAALRGLLPLVAGFFIMYSSVKDTQDINSFLRGFLLLGLIAGIYGLYQEFVGLPSFDLAWATHDENLYGALFTWGRLRKFSFFVSPSEFAITMAIIGMVGFVLLFYEKNVRLFYFSLVTSIICLWSMLYTGSRTAMILLPAGLIIFLLISLKRNVLILLFVFTLAGVAMILRPANSAMFVMSTAFSGANDPSMNVRILNQQIIRSYILDNPIGFGLGSTGYLGTKYSPNTFISTFPPDSEYVRVAIETGWIGLLLWCIILGILFGYSVFVYFRIDNIKWKGIVVTILVVLFIMILAQYPQEIFKSQVLTVVFSSMIGLIAKIDTMNDKLIAFQAG